MSILCRDSSATVAAADRVMAPPAIHGVERNRKYQTVLIGSGRWEMNMLRTAVGCDGSQVVALCDVNCNQLDPCGGEI
jgi:hypothetical protein